MTQQLIKDVVSSRSLSSLKPGPLLWCETSQGAVYVICHSSMAYGYPQGPPTPPSCNLSGSMLPSFRLECAGCIAVSCSHSGLNASSPLVVLVLWVWSPLTAVEGLWAHFLKSFGVERGCVSILVMVKVPAGLQTHTLRFVGLKGFSLPAHHPVCVLGWIWGMPQLWAIACAGWCDCWFQCGHKLMMLLCVVDTMLLYVPAHEGCPPALMCHLPSHYD